MLDTNINDDSEVKFNPSPRKKVRDTYDQMLSLPKSVKSKINKICLHKNKKISHLFCEFINKELAEIEGKNSEAKIKSELVEEKNSMLFAFHEIMRELKKQSANSDISQITKIIQGINETIIDMRKEQIKGQKFRLAYQEYSRTGDKSSLKKLDD